MQKALLSESSLSNISIGNSIIANFSKQAVAYEQVAHAQKTAAQRLDTLIANRITLPIFGNILDIGCGTGLLSRYLIQRFPDCQTYLIDPASGMLQTCKKSISQQLALFSDNAIKQPLFIENTIENYLINLEYKKVKYRLIASSFTFHWLADLPTVVSELVDRLEIGGQLVFSYPIAGSFPEWHELCDQLNLPFTANPFPSINELTLAINPRQAKIDCNEYYYQRNFSSALQFFQEMKIMGAATPILMRQSELKQPTELTKHISISNLRRLIRTWDQQTKSKNSEANFAVEDKYNQSVSCTYRLIEGIITRHS